MKLACWVVTRKLAGLSPGGTLPGWVAGHIDECEHCASEEAAYIKLSAVLKTDDPADKTCGLSWDSLRSALETRPAETLVPRRRRAWVTVGASAAAAALVITAAASLWLRPVSKQIPNQPQAVRQAERKPAPRPAPMIAEQPSTPNQPETDALAPAPRTLPSTSTAPSAPTIGDRAHRRHPIVSRIRPNVAAVRHRRMRLPWSRDDATMIANADTTEPTTSPRAEDRHAEPPELAIVAPSEHVIDVVGAGSLGEGEKVGMIQQVSYREGSSSARL